MNSRYVFAPQPGTVAKTRVKHGDTVKEGDVLIVLRNPQLPLSLREALTVHSPVDGTVADVQQHLLNRPVAAGQFLVEIHPKKRAIPPLRRLFQRSPEPDK